MNETDQKLLQGLRELAAEGPRDAPAELEARLVGEFRKRAQARRRNVLLGVGTAAIAAALALTVIRPALLQHAPAAQVSPQADDAALDFYPLPDSEELPPLESATIVRVQLPMASLRLMGLPVSEEGAADLVEADMLLGQDGMARGVRFVE
ncbi:MAG TPA: hypothetical protein VKT81_22750 [Bryobacteraceae bacterium]|nr:hypothetical protein [Bryobacteraceae bacterium]